MARNLRRFVAPFVVVLAGAAWLAPSASAAITSQTIAGTATPSTQSQTNFAPASLNMVGNTTYDGTFAPSTTDATVHFDNDFAFDATGIPQCSQDLSGLDTAEAEAACGTSKVGFGTITVGHSIFGSTSSTVRVYNTAPSGGNPAVIVHVYTAADDSTVVTSAVIVDSTAGGDFGKQIALDVPTLPAGFAPTQISLTLQNNLVEARCNDGNTTWDYQVDYLYDGAPGSQTVTDTQSCSLPQQSLSVSKTGAGTGTITGTGINCPGDCSQSYPEGTMVDLTATPTGGSTFAGWSGDCTGTGACQVTMDAARSVSAAFSTGAGATLTGVVTEPASAGGDPLLNSNVWACGETTDVCQSDLTDGSGTYSILDLPADAYYLYAGPPFPGPEYEGADDEVAVSGTGTFIRNLQLGDPPLAPPNNVEIDNGGDLSGGGIPSVYASKDFTLSVTGAAGCSASYSVTTNAIVDASGPMAESPAGVYSALVDLTLMGKGLVAITVDCPNPGDDQNIAFNIYIDPSGFVRNLNTGATIPGATVVLQRSDSAAGPFTQVPNGSDIMSPGNRTNPDTTDATGHFGWDVIAGYYKVIASAPGCVTGETAVLTIPPPVTDLDIGLSCPPPPSGGGGGTTPVTTPLSTASAPKKCKKGQKLKKGKCVKKKKKK